MRSLQPPPPQPPVLIALENEQLRLPLLLELLSRIKPRVIACSGGIDSLLLATVAHRQDPAATVVAHALSPAVPTEATNRVKEWAEREGWNLQQVVSGEFYSEDYLSNPVNRCYHCKSHLYSSLDQLAANIASGATLLSGANLNDLGEYRPGLIAAQENAVRHPYVEVDIDKQSIRSIARRLQLPFAELPASPCLASRLYTGTRVTAERLRAIEQGEALIRQSTGLTVVRCRIRESQMFIEVGEGDRRLIGKELLHSISALVQSIEPGICSVQLDSEPYRSGRAFVVSPT